MKRCSILLLTLLLGTGSAFAKKNVVFIMTDDLNDFLGCYGGHPEAQTPNIDKLAERGMLFRNAYCQYPLCGPSRTSMMTGMYPDQTQQYSLHQLLRETHPDAVTLSQHFKNNGYAAARVGKIYHYMNPSHIGRDGHDDPASWDEKINPYGRDKIIQNNNVITYVEKKKTPGGSLCWYADPTGTDEEHTDGMVATESIKLMQNYVKQKTPFFLGVGFYKPHLPFIAPKKYFDLYDVSKIEVPPHPQDYLDTIPVPAQKTIHAHDSLALSDQTIRESVLAYLATISFLDAQVGRVMDAIDALGQRENTIILFASDHGFHMGEHLHFQKTTLFEESARVPLIISVPGMEHPGQESDAMVEIVDFYPTLSELAGLPAPVKIAGISLVPILKDPNATVRESALTQIKNLKGYSIRTDRFRYTRWAEGGKDMIELYDWNKDADEMVNQANNPEYEAQLKALNMLWEKRVKQANTLPEGVKILPPKPVKPKKKKMK